jgi:hypothetical protein
MTLLNYTDFVPTPAPVTSGSTIQSYTDPLGDVWVAKNGVYAGAWKRARDVLHPRVYRNAALTMPTASTVVPFDTVWLDTYGLWTPGSSQTYSFVLPVPGIYQAWAQTGFSPTASGQWIQSWIQQNGTAFLTTRAHASTTANSANAPMIVTQTCAVGDQINVAHVCSTAVPATTNQNNLTFGVDYLGTG